MAKKGGGGSAPAPSRAAAPAPAPARAASSAPARSSAPAARQAAVSAAKTAVSTGGFTKETAQDLRQAGVNPTKIKDLRTQSQAVNQRNATAAAATTGNANVNQAIDAQFNGGFNIGRDFYNSPGFQDVLNQNINADGTRMSEAQVAKYAMDKGYGLGDKYMAEFGTTTQPRKASNFRQAVKLAASNDPLNLLTRKEARSIYEDYQDKKNLDSMKFTGILDKMNANFDKKGKQQIGLGGGALNLLYSGKLGNTGIPLGYGQSYMRQGQEVPLFGGKPQYGGLSGVLRNMGQTGKFNRGDTIYGQYSTGQFRDSPGAGRAWKDSKWAMPETVTYQPFAKPSGAGNDGGTGGGEVAPPELPPEEPQTPDANQFGAGSDIASFASGWKSRKGLRANAGRGAQGFASMRIAPSYSSGVGTNYG